MLTWAPTATVRRESTSNHPYQQKGPKRARRAAPQPLSVPSGWAVGGLTRGVTHPAVRGQPGARARGGGGGGRAPRAGRWARLLASVHAALRLLPHVPSACPSQPGARASRPCADPCRSLRGAHSPELLLPLSLRLRLSSPAVQPRPLSAVWVLFPSPPPLPFPFPPFLPTRSTKRAWIRSRRA